MKTTNRWKSRQYFFFVAGVAIGAQEDVGGGRGDGGEAAEEIAVDSVVGDGPACPLHPRAGRRQGRHPRVPRRLLPALEARVFSLVYRLQVVLDGRVRDRASHPVLFLHDPVLPVARAAAGRDCPGLQQHVVV
jgi:hypothetical protein